MEAIIRTENKTLFEMILYFLKSLKITVETKEKQRVSIAGRKKDKWAELDKIISPMRKGLPKGYKFDREEANAR